MTGNQPEKNLPTVTNNPFSYKLTRYVVLTYNHLPQNIDISKSVNNIVGHIYDKINKSACKDVKLEEVQLQKEPYDIISNPDNKDLSHIHALFVLSRPVDLRAYYIWTEIFSFVHEYRKYKPYVCKLRNMKDYLSYISKLHEKDVMYAHDSWYYTSGNTAKMAFDNFIQECHEGGETMSIRQFKRGLANLPVSIINNHNNRSIINFHRGNVYNNVNVYEKLEHCELNKQYNLSLDEVKNDKTSECIARIEEIIIQYLSEMTKYSLWFFGASSVGKTTLINTICESISTAQQVETVSPGFNKGVKFYYITNSLENMPHSDPELLQNLDDNLLHVIICDDIVFKYGGKNDPDKGYYDRKSFLGILSGNKFSGTWPMIQTSGLQVPSKKVKKLFIYNDPIETVLQQGLSKEEKKNFKVGDAEAERVKQFRIYKDVHDVLHIEAYIPRDIKPSGQVN